MRSRETKRRQEFGRTVQRESISPSANFPIPVM